jgi:hypothetical protein
MIDDEHSDIVHSTSITDGGRIYEQEHTEEEMQDFGIKMLQQQVQVCEKHQSMEQQQYLQHEPIHTEDMVTWVSLLISIETIISFSWKNKIMLVHTS